MPTIDGQLESIHNNVETSRIDYHIDQVWTKFQETRKGQANPEETLGTFFSDLLGVAGKSSGDKISYETEALKISEKYNIPIDSLKKVASVCSAFEQSLDTLLDASVMWQAVEDEVGQKVAYNYDKISQHEFSPETKTELQRFNQTMVDLYIAAESSQNSSDLQKVKAFSQLFRPGTHVSGGLELKNRDMGARTHAAIAIALKDHGFKVLLPDKEDPEEVSLWENAGADMVIMNQNSEIFIIDSKSRKFKQVGEEKQINHIIEVNDQLEPLNEDQLKIIKQCEAVFNIKYNSSERSTVRRKIVEMPSQFLTQKNSLARYSAETALELVQKIDIKNKEQHAQRNRKNH